MGKDKSVLERLADTVKGIASTATEAASQALKADEPGLRADERAMAYVPLAADGLVSDPLMVPPVAAAPARRKRAGKRRRSATTAKATKAKVGKSKAAKAGATRARRSKKAASRARAVPPRLPSTWCSKPGPRRQREHREGHGETGEAGLRRPSSPRVDAPVLSAAHGPLTRAAGSACGFGAWLKRAQAHRAAQALGQIPVPAAQELHSGGHQ